VTPFVSFASILVAPVDSLLEKDTRHYDCMSRARAVRADQDYLQMSGELRSRAHRINEMIQQTRSRNLGMGIP
jgi:hypothetical protein